MIISGIGVPFEDAKLEKHVTWIHQSFVHCEEATTNNLWRYPNIERCSQQLYI